MEGGAATGPLLNNLSLTILPGSMTAIVGARRSGKTAGRQRNSQKSALESLYIDNLVSSRLLRISTISGARRSRNMVGRHKISQNSAP